MTEDPSNFEGEEQLKSKSQIKREMEALQALGKRLCELKPAQRNDVPLSQSLLDAIDLYNKIRQKEAKRRQLQFIGKLMRAEDGDAIAEALEKFDTSSRKHAQSLHQTEAWRAKLINEGNQAITDFVESHPGIDVQQLRQWVRKAQKDAQTGKNTGGAKKLFQFIRAIED